jgi:hypothetical protein
VPHSATTPTDASGGDAVSEVVTRPEPGIGRGRWEAPAWVFVVVAVAAFVSGALWALQALLGRRKR